MIGNNVALDTNIIIDYLDEQPDIKTVVDKLSSFTVPVIAKGELYIGIYRSLPQLKKSKIEEIEKFIRTTTVIEVDSTTANYYAQVKTKLFKKGRPIPENDVWIAAIVLQHNLQLYTNDSHFSEVEGLQLFEPSSLI